MNGASITIDMADVRSHHTEPNRLASSGEAAGLRAAVVLRGATGWLIGPLFMVACCLVSPAQSQVVVNPALLWRNLLADAAGLKLPVKFLEEIPAGFVQFEFDDLRTFAAEYHPADHRMILNRALSFNRAGGTLRPLRQLTHKDLQTLYHELFHAYMDYLTVESRRLDSGGASSESLMGFARDQQHCRYEHVLITPIPQRKNQTEERFLSEEESWELLNETWAVFVGWAIWTQLEVAHSKQKQPIDSPAGTREWIERLRKADNGGDFRGYYEPQDTTEKAISQKRFMAPAFRISPPEVRMLMEKVLGGAADRIDRSVRLLEKGADEMPLRLCAPSDAH
ncbi:MAG: hypothetical protein NW701_19190 [Nitrospira sp.]